MATGETLLSTTTRVPATLLDVRPEERAAFRESHSWPVVLDASAVLDDILYATGPPGRLSALSMSLKLGVLRPYGKVDVLEEVERNLVRIGRSNYGPMRDRLHADYVPYL